MSSKLFEQLLVFKKRSREQEIKKLTGSYLSISNYLTIKGSYHWLSCSINYQMHHDRDPHL